MPASPTGTNRQSDCTCGSLRKASRRISKFYDIALAPIGIKSTQYSILSELDRRREHGVTMRELAQALVMDRSTLGHNLRPLQRDELLSLKQAADDRRRRYIELTKRGQAVLKRARRRWRVAESRFARIFGKRHAAELRSVLLNIAANENLNSLSVD